MRHRVKGRTLGRSHSHRSAMLRNLVASLVLHERVTTTKEKAKEARTLAENLITLGKKGDLHSRRQAIKKLHDVKAVHKVFEDLSKRNATRNGGYTRIISLDKTRLGDNASQVIFEWVERNSGEGVGSEELVSSTGETSEK